MAMSSNAIVSDQQTVAWLARHKVGILSVLAGVAAAESWAVHTTGQYLTFTGMVFFGLIAYGVRYLAGLMWWWNRRRILLAKHSLPAPGPLEMWRRRSEERKKMRYVTKQWNAFCTANGIVGTGKIVPKLHQFAATVNGDLTAVISPGAIGVKGAAGMTAVERIRSLGPNIAETCGCPGGVLVRPTGIGNATLTFLWADPLGRLLPIANMPTAPDDQIAFGVTSRGVASIPMSMHALMGGMSGYGKSSWMHALLADLNRKGIKYVVNMIDPKGGAEFKAMRPHVGTWGGNRFVQSYCKTGDEESIKVLGSVVDALKERQNVFEGRKWTPADADQYPLQLLMIDECLEVFETWGDYKPDAKTAKGKPMNDFVKVLLSQGRAAGFMVIALTQTAEVNALGSGVRRMFPKRYALATDNATGTAMILGDNAEAEGARCSKIKIPGRGFGQTEGVRGYEEFQVGYCEDDDIERIAAGLVPEGMDDGAKGEVNRSTAVYRFFNVVGELLYVGKTVDVAARFGQHAASKAWWGEVDMARTLVTWHPSEPAALRVEEHEIKTRLPRYNKQHNGANPLARAYVKPEPTEPGPSLMRLVLPERRKPQPWEFRPVRVSRKRNRKPLPVASTTPREAPAAYTAAAKQPAPSAYTRNALK
jgi:hypothetical protein